jgi:small subunit ribosomal protein S20
MPNTKSAKKRLKQSLVRRSRNRAAKSELKTLSRKVREGIAAGKLDEATTEYRALSRKLDRAAAGNVLHDNAAARVKSRLSAAIKAAKQGPKPAAS